MNKKLKGITLIEAGLWVLLLSLAITATAQFYRNNRQSDLYHSEAQYMQDMQTLVQGYVNQNRDAVDHMRSNSILTCNSSLNLCDINLANLMISVDSSIGNLGTNTIAGVQDVYGKSAFVRIVRTGIAPNYTFNGIIVTDHSITHDGATTPATDLLGSIVQLLGVNGAITANDGNVYGFQGSWSAAMSSFMLNTCNGCLAYRFGDWAGDPSNALYLPIDGSKAMQGAMNLANFNINNVDNVIATTAVVGHENGVDQSTATVNGSIAAVGLNYYESQNGQTPLGINIGPNLVLNTTYNTTTSTLGGIALYDKTQGINLYGTSFYANDLTSQNSCSYTSCTTADATNLATLNVLGTTTVNTNYLQNFTSNTFDNYGTLTITAPSTSGAALGQSFLTQQLTVDGDSSINYFGINQNSGVPDTTNNITIGNLYVPSGATGNLNTMNIQADKLETYAMGPNPGNGGASYGSFVSPVYSNMLLLQYANDATAFNKYGLDSNINTAAATTTVYASGTGVALATCPTGYYAYGGGANAADTTTGAGVGCTDPNDWANGVKSQQQANYPVGVTQWAVVCTYPGANPPQPITANAYVLCYQPATN
jgi:hypothetical protein